MFSHIRDYSLLIIFFSGNACSAIVNGMLEPGDAAVHDDSDASDSVDLDNISDEMTGIDPLDSIENELPLCLPPLQECGSQCTDITTDRRNCGGCGTVCEAPYFCQGGFCVCPSGIAGWMDCDGDCVDTMTDPLNCGGCAVLCDSFQVCDGRGNCSGSCAEGFSVCEDTGGTRTCADIKNDPFNCGFCGNACASLSYMVSGCTGGECSFTCEPGWMNADGILDNGCECYERGPEVCNGDDDDCDMDVDEDFACVANARESCIYASSSCIGTRTCNGTFCTWSECTVEGAECFPPESTGSCTAANGCTGTRTCSSSCIWSECEETCPVVCCPTGCEDTRTDRNNCGVCGRNCKTDETCSGGLCVSTDASEDVVEDSPEEPDIPEEIDTRDLDVP